MFFKSKPLNYLFLQIFFIGLVSCSKGDANTSHVTKIADVEKNQVQSDKPIIVRGEVEVLLGTMDTFYVTIMDSSGSLWLAMDNNAPGASDINLYTYGEFEIHKVDNIKQHPKMKNIKVNYMVKKARAVTQEVNASL